MRTLAIAVGIGVCLVLGYVVVHLAFIELGQEIVVLHKTHADDPTSRHRLWIVDEGERTWIHHDGPDASWIRQLETDPFLVVERGGETRRYRARTDEAAHPLVHRLLREKYGFADRMVRFWAGTERDEGVVGLCPAVPILLEPISGPEPVATPPS